MLVVVVVKLLSLAEGSKSTVPRYDPEMIIFPLLSSANEVAMSFKLPPKFIADCNSNELLYFAMKASVNPFEVSCSVFMEGSKSIVSVR